MTPASPATIDGVKPTTPTASAAVGAHGADAMRAMTQQRYGEAATSCASRRSSGPRSQTTKCSSACTPPAWTAASSTS